MAKLGTNKNKKQHTAHKAKTAGTNTSAFKKGNASTNPSRARPTTGHTHLRSKATINRLNMYRSKANPEKMKAAPKVPMVRIQPDRRWFGNTRVLAQNKLQTFREEMSKSVDDPFNVVLKASKLPMTLLKDDDKDSKANLLQVESFAHTFGAKKLRKKPKLAVDSLADLLEASEKKNEDYDTDKDKQATVTNLEIAEQYDPCANHKFETSRDGEKYVARTLVSENVFLKGTSKRIFSELYKVIDSSDVVLEVIDARDPMGTRNLVFEREFRKQHPHKKLVLLMNKCDLIPAWAASRWQKVLNKEYPTVAFHASVTNSFGKGALIQLLRQFAMLLKQRQHVQIGLVGYPNVGKSSVINALKMKKVCKAAPIPGQTRVWQYVSLTKRIFMIDCPGIVPPTKNDLEADQAKVLKGVVRIEKVEFPSNFVPEVFQRVKHKYIVERYGFPKDQPVWTDHDDFLTELARKMGKLRKGGEPDIEIAARTVLYDWQKGRIPYFSVPPEPTAEEEEEEKKLEEGEEAAPKISVGQKFSELKTALNFDEDDAGSAEDDEDAGKRFYEEEEGAEYGEEAARAAAKAKGKKRGRDAVQDDAEEDDADKPKKKGAKTKGDKRAKTSDKGAKTKAKKPSAAPSKALDWDKIGDEFAS